MKAAMEFLWDIMVGAAMAALFFCGVALMIDLDAKAKLEIKVLQHELKAYEEMDKELKSE